MIPKTVVKGEHDPDFFVRCPSIFQFSRRNNFKLSLEKQNMLLKNSGIYPIASALPRNTMIQKDYGPSGR